MSLATAEAAEHGGPPPLLSTLHIETSEYNSLYEKAKKLVHVYRTQAYTKENINVVYTEWKDIMYRIKKGDEMIQELVEQGKQNTEQYENMSDLYIALSCIAGLYSQFFQRFGYERFLRAWEDIGVSPCLNP